MRASLFCLFVVVVATSFKSAPEQIDFYCFKTHKATNTCHFNFKVDGARYRYVDQGCKFSRKQEEIIRKVKEGAVALSRDWKFECAEVKPDSLKNSAGGF